MTTFSIQKLRTKTAVKFDNHAVKLNGSLVGIIGRQSRHSSTYMFFSKAEEMNRHDNRKFFSLDAAKYFFKYYI